MNATPITEKDIRVLQKSQSKAVRLTTLIMFPFAVTFMVAVGGINLYLCSHYSSMAGISVADVIRGWFAGIDTSANYSGMYLKAMERWVTAITQFAAACAMAFMFAAARRASRRNARILRFIEEKSS